MRDLTPVEFRRLKTSLEIVDNQAETIAYQHTVFCQTCLPYKSVQQRIWERHDALGASLCPVRTISPYGNEFSPNHINAEGQGTRRPQRFDRLVAFFIDPHYDAMAQ